MFQDVREKLQKDVKAKRGKRKKEGKRKGGGGGHPINLGIFNPFKRYFVFFDMIQ